MKYLIRRPRRGVSLFNDDFFNDFFDFGVRSNVPRIMRTDIIEEEDKYVLNIDIPGFAKEDIKLSFEEGYVKVEATSEESEETEDVNYLRRERHFGTCVREFYIGDVAKEKITAEFTDGVLTVTVPKEKEEVLDKAKTIEIK